MVLQMKKKYSTGHICYENDRILLEDATSDPILVLASHGITLSGVGWNTFQDNDHS